MNEPDADPEARLQEEQYAYPYHYLPRVEDGRFTQVRYWSWGLHYLGGIQVVLDQLEGLAFDSLLDVGCGDGRFLRELHRRFPEVEALGIDYSTRSIALANGMNPELTFEVRDLLEEPLNASYDVVTAVEVLEHIEPERCGPFVEAMRDALADDGRLVLTVPHANKPVSEKHYRHFDGDALQDLLKPNFAKVELIPFDRRSLVLEGIKALLGWRGEHFIVNSPFILNRVRRFYEERCLYAATESDCRRIAAVATVPDR